MLWSRHGCTSWRDDDSRPFQPRPKYDADDFRVSSGLRLHLLHLELLDRLFLPCRRHKKAAAMFCASIYICLVCIVPSGAGKADGFGVKKQ